MKPTYLSQEAIADAKGRPLDLWAPGLWCCGSLEGLAKPCVAIVGTRAATAHGRHLAREAASRLGRAGCAIVSGLALGIDSAAHEGALAAGAPTIGVLGGGHTRFFPPRNLGLAERMIVAGGAVVSPFEPDWPAYARQFLQRNGIVAGIADAVLVIEAPARSGALNTANWAAGRIPVLAIPGDVDRPSVQGCLALIRDGAILARGAEDVLEVLGLSRPPREDACLPSVADPDARTLLEALQDEAQTLDELAIASRLRAPAVLAALTALELEGLVERRGSSTYVRVLRLFP
jgi:DNA processing protein